MLRFKHFGYFFALLQNTNILISFIYSSKRCGNRMNGSFRFNRRFSLFSAKLHTSHAFSQIIRLFLEFI